MFASVVLSTLRITKPQCLRALSGELRQFLPLPCPGDSGYRFTFAAGFPNQVRGRVSRMSAAGGTIARRSPKFFRRKTFRSSVLRGRGGGQNEIHAGANLGNHSRQVKNSGIMVCSHLDVVPGRQTSRHGQCF